MYICDRIGLVDIAGVGGVEKGVGGTKDTVVNVYISNHRSHCILIGLECAQFERACICRSVCARTHKGKKERRARTRTHTHTAESMNGMLNIYTTLFFLYADEF